MVLFVLYLFSQYFVGVFKGNRNGLLKQLGIVVFGTWEPRSSKMCIFGFGDFYQL